MSDWKESVFRDFRLYAVTDLTEFNDRTVSQVEAACEGGADIIQLRSKAMTDSELYRAGLKLKDVIGSQRKLFFVNDRLDLALALNADGVHVGQDDLPLKLIREIVDRQGRRLWIGKSTHSLEQAKLTVEEKPDYIGVGPIFGTPTKPDYVPVGPDLIRKVASWIQIPFVAIGGIQHQNIKEVLQAGAMRVAVVRGIFSAEDVYVATRKLREQIEYANGQPC